MYNRNMNTEMTNEHYTIQENYIFLLMLQSMMSHVHQAAQVAGDRKENSVMPFHVEFVTALRQTEDVFLYLRS